MGASGPLTAAVEQGALAMWPELEAMGFKRCEACDARRGVKSFDASEAHLPRHRRRSPNRSLSRPRFVADSSAVVDAIRRGKSGTAALSRLPAKHARPHPSRRTRHSAARVGARPPRNGARQVPHRQPRRARRGPPREGPGWSRGRSAGAHGAAEEGGRLHVAQLPALRLAPPLPLDLRPCCARFRCRIRSEPERWGALLPRGFTRPSGGQRSNSSRAPRLERLVVPPRPTGARGRCRIRGLAQDGLTAPEGRKTRLQTRCKPMSREAPNAGQHDRGELRVSARRRGHHPCERGLVLVGEVVGARRRQPETRPEGRRGAQLRQRLCPGARSVVESRARRLPFRSCSGYAFTSRSVFLKGDANAARHATAAPRASARRIERWSLDCSRTGARGRRARRGRAGRGGERHQDRRGG